MRPLLVAIALAGCHAAAPPSRPMPAPAPTPALHVGAMVVPGEDPAPPVRDRSTDLVDPTVALAALPTADAAWQTRETLADKGRVAIALHITGDTFLDLAVVDTVTVTETGYPDSLRDIQVAPIDPHSGPEDGNTFPARDTDPTTGDYRGPIMFAIRALPSDGAPEAQRRQYVVYTRDRGAFFVADKLVTETTWTPRMRFDTPHATEIVAINPGWH